MSSAPRPRTSWIGTGQATRVLAPLMLEAGYPIDRLASRRIADARRLARRLPGCRAAEPAAALAGDLPSGTRRLVLLAVPDRRIAEVADELAAAEAVAWRSIVALHLAGSLGPEELAPLADRGAAVGTFHPLQSLADPAAAARTLPGSRVRIEGDATATRIARRLARDLDLVPLRFPRPLDQDGRASYHAAATLAHNDMIALLGIACDLLRDTGLDERAAIRALVPLVRGGLEQIERRGLAEAITGPVLRGDADTLAAHLSRLGRDGSDDRTTHRLLSRRLLKMTRQRRQPPSASDRRRVRELLK